MVLKLKKIVIKLYDNLSIFFNFISLVIAIVLDVIIGIRVEKTTPEIIVKGRIITMQNRSHYLIRQLGIRRIKTRIFS